MTLMRVLYAAVEIQYKYNHDCEGKAYKSRHKLTCKFYIMVHIHYRASNASRFIHSELKAGHIHAMEASYNVLIRFPRKHIALKQLHYHLSTDLGLLQVNSSSERATEGARYHWMPELYSKMGLTLHDGLKETLKKFCKERDHQLEKQKKTSASERKLVGKLNASWIVKK